MVMKRSERGAQGRGWSMLMSRDGGGVAGMTLGTVSRLSMGTEEIDTMRKVRRVAIVNTKVIAVQWSDFGSGGTAEKQWSVESGDQKS